MNGREARHGNWSMEAILSCIKTYSHPLNNILTPSSPPSNTHTISLTYMAALGGTNPQQSPTSTLYSNLSIFPRVWLTWIVSTLKTKYFPRCKAKKLKITKEKTFTRSVLRRVQVNTVTNKKPFNLNPSQGRKYMPDGCIFLLFRHVLREPLLCMIYDSLNSVYHTRHD